MQSVKEKDSPRNPAKAVSRVTLEKPRPLMRKIERGASGFRWRSS